MSKIKSILKNITYTVSSNLLSLIVSTVITLVLPRILGVESYGYYQLYLFYVSYVGFLHFGWCDGIYLKYGGEKYENLDKSLFKGQFYALLLFQTIITISFLVFINLIDVPDEGKYLVFSMVPLNIVILNVRTYCVFVLQSTNRMKDYSIITVSDRLIYILLVLICIFLGYKSFIIYIVMDVLAKLISLIISIFKIKEMTFSKVPIKWNLDESLDNIKVGINLMFANIASVLIIGIVRFGIQAGWDVSTFGKISLTLSISNMLMVFVNAISLAIFPLLKRAEESEYDKLYIMIRTLLMPLVLIILLFYFPLKLILGVWLPMYDDSLKYMAIIFPMIVFESKVSLLSNTFLKALRKEREILKVNLITALLSLVLTVIVVQLFHNLHLSMLLIVVLLLFRSTLSEYVLSKYLDVKIKIDIFLEVTVSFIFIFLSWNYSAYLASLIYLFVLVCYLLVKRKDFMYVKKYINSIRQ